MKLGILGGSFNPIHEGHLAMADAVRKAHGLDLVMFVPAGRPPHKGSDLASADDRLQMARLAVEGREVLTVSDVEVRRPGVSYTVDTLEEIHRQYPEAELFFIIGEDSVPELSGWRNPRRILELARVVAVNRPGSNAAFRSEAFPGVPLSTIERLQKDRVAMPPSPLGATQIRDDVRKGRSLVGKVPPRVAEYIRRRGLYGS